MSVGDCLYKAGAGNKVLGEFGDGAVESFGLCVDRCLIDGGAVDGFGFGEC